MLALLLTGCVFGLGTPKKNSSKPDFSQTVQEQSSSSQL